MFILNFFLIYIVLESSRKTVAPTAGLHQKQGLHRKVQMTKTIILMTLSFIVLTLPGAIVSGFYYLKLMSLDFGPLIINLCDDISFSFHSMTLFTLLYSNKAFFNQFQVVFFNKVFVQENSVSHTAHTNWNLICLFYAYLFLPIANNSIFKIRFGDFLFFIFLVVYSVGNGFKGQNIQKLNLFQSK